MTARAWLNIGLVALLAALATIAWLRPGQTPPDAARVLRIDADAIERIAIARGNKPVIRIERRHQQWWLKSPIHVRASVARVASLLELAIRVSAARYPADTLELARYGLAEPAVVIKLNGNAIAFGQINPVNQRRYVQVRNTVHLIDDVLFDLESSGAAAYASTRLLPEAVKIRALHLPDISISRAKVSARRSSPPTLPPRIVRKTLRAWREASAMLVSAYRGKPSGDQVTVELEHGPPMVFSIVASGRELILARPALHLQYHLPATSSVTLFPVSAGAKQP